MSRLKLYLNENLSWRIAKALREYGYDVVSSEEAAMNETDDATQLAFAVSEQRAIVTNNIRDFVELDEHYTTEHKPHYGILLTTKCSFALLIKRLRNVLERIPAEEMMNQTWWLNDFD
jgi:predicted nuclease of predicted toxin-antitoxin system